MNVVPNPHLSLEQVADRYLQNEKTSAQSHVPKGQIAFGDILKQKAEAATVSGPLKFSKHATNRLADRQIELSADQMRRLDEAAALAREKGIKESLVMVDSLAFIVNIPNHTVVTAMDQTQANENVYTNIDGAVIM